MQILRIDLKYRPLFVQQSTHSEFPLLTVGGRVGVEDVGEQALLDGGVPAQCLLVQDEQEAVELLEELVQHWKHKTDRQNI